MQSRFLDPALLAATDDLPLIARTVVDGFLLGQHPSRRKGAGLEFNQYRGYEPGDDPRLLDWKMFARSDRYFVREADEETNIAVWLLLDTSASMAHRDRNDLTKLRVARMLAAVFAYLACAQGDAVGLLTAGGERPVYLSPRGGRRHLYRLFAELDGMTAGGRWPAWPEIETTLTRDRKRALYVVISDLYEADGEIHGCLRRLRAIGHELIVCHLVAGNEWRLDQDGPVRVRDLETGRVTETDGAQIAASLRQRLTEHRRAWSESLGELRADYAWLNLDEPLDTALRTFLHTRSRLP